MTNFQIIIVIELGFIAFAAVWASDALGKHTRHLSNIADRILDIELFLKNGR